MIESILFIALGLCLGGALATLIMQRKQTALERENASLIAQSTASEQALAHASKQLDDRFKATAQEALSQSQELFLKLAQEKFSSASKDSAHDLDKRQRAIDEMIKPVQQNLQNLNQSLEQMKGTDQSLKEEIKSLGKETARLVGALRDPTAQGKWGEFILEGILDKSGLMKGIHYNTQVTMNNDQGTRRPDAVIHMQDGFHIIIDAKAPINEFTQRLEEQISEDEYQTIIKNLSRQVREHTKSLGKKNYWDQLESPDFTVLFLPSEHIYSLALRADPDLVNFAAQNNIIIASPTLLISLLRVVSLSWRQVELAQNAQEISAQGQELYKRLLTFTGHIEKVGKNLGHAMRGYNDAIGSMERSVLPAARKFKNLQGNAQSTPDLNVITQDEKPPRELSLTLDDEHELQKQNNA